MKNKYILLYIVIRKKQRPHYVSVCLLLEIESTQRTLLRQSGRGSILAECILQTVSVKANTLLSDKKRPRVSVFQKQILTCASLHDCHALNDTLFLDM